MVPCLALLSASMVFAAPHTIAQIGDTVRTQSQDAPLLPIRDLMLEVERNQRRFEAAEKDYTYHVHTEQREFDSSGGIKKTTVTDAESLSIDGVRVDKIVAKNGKPLSPDEMAKENARIDKRVAKAKERQEKNESKGRETDSEGNEVVTVSRILELGTFSNPRRVALDGRTMILLDYNGDPHAKTRNSLEGIIRDLTGQVWIDAQDHVLARGVGQFANDFKIGGGLVADIHKGFQFDFRSTKINGEVWLPARIDAQGSARLLLFAQVRGSFTLTASDYRKFRTSTTIIPSNRLIGADGQPLTEQPGTAPEAPAPH